MRQTKESALNHYDVFNGDADGICALQQLRLVSPRCANLITGVKRSINLLAEVPSGEESTLTVLDISLDKNRNDLLRLLDDGAIIDYFDHHVAGDIPDSTNLTTHIDTSADLCTSLLVNRHLQGAHPLWAATGAFGDNLFDKARNLAASAGATPEQIAQLETLGTLLNYNGYGTTLDDLFFHPADLYRAISAYPDPLVFANEHTAFATLKQGYADDISRIRNLPADSSNTHSLLLILPDTDWSRRVSGVYGNLLARQHPDRAHALATTLPDGKLRISVRAPLHNRQGADRLCMQFPTGGGRAAAAGINALPADMFDDFSKQFRQFWRQPRRENESKYIDDQCSTDDRNQPANRSGKHGQTSWQHAHHDETGRQQS